MEALPDGASLRLIHNGCKTDAPRCEAEVVSRCVLVSAAGTSTKHLQVCLTLRQSHHASITDRVSLRLLPSRHEHSD